MNDRELLELAAKAAGIDLDCTVRPDCKPFYHSDRNAFAIAGGGWFAPLTDDGDALRLATELELNIFHVANSAYAMPSDDDGTNEQQVSYSDAGGKNVATRLAIVRAAAEIGKDKS